MAGMAASIAWSAWFPRGPARDPLAERGLLADPETVQRIGMAIFRARWDVARLMLRRVDGDWRPGETAARGRTALPSPAVKQSAQAADKKTSLTTLLAGFAVDKGRGRLDDKPISRGLYDRKRTLARLEAFLGHGDATAVTRADAVIAGRASLMAFHSPSMVRAAALRRDALSLEKALSMGLKSGV